MGVAELSGSDRKIPVHRLVPALSVKIIRFLSMGYNGFPKGCSRMMNFPRGKGMYEESDPYNAKVLLRPTVS